MAEFKLDRFKYTWKGNWSTTTAYLKDDVVQFNGSSYVCIVAHTSTTNFYTEFLKQDTVNNVPTPFWVKMTDGYVWTGPWLPNTAYQLGDIVKVNGNVYICVTNHTSGIALIPDDGNWITYIDQTKFRQDWQSFTLYEINDIVRYGGTVYRCITSHVSSSLSTGLEGNISRWEVYYSGIEYRGKYEENTKYKLNDIVLYKATLLRCTTAHTSTTIFDETKWDIELSGELFAGEWNPNSYYSVGNIVKAGGYLYYSLTNNINSLPNASIYDLNGSEPDWEVLSKGINFSGTWNSSTSYKAGDVVRRGGHLYVALLDTEIAADGSSLDYLDASNWELLTTGSRYTGNWSSLSGEEQATYGAGDIVKYIGNTYRAIIEHIPTEDNSPTGLNGAIHWELILKAGPNTALQYEGDLLSYGFNPEDYGNFDALKTINISIGAPGQLLTIEPARAFLPPVSPIDPSLEISLGKELSYTSWGVSDRTAYVEIHGVDDDDNPDRGFSPFLPWRTIQFAATRLNDNFEGTTTINVGVGVFEEILPIVIPKNTVILGSELRSTVVKANSPVAELQSDEPLTSTGLLRLVEIIENVVIGNIVNKTAGNPLTQSLFGRKPIQVPFDPPQFDQQDNEIFQTIEVNVTGSGPSGIAVLNLIEEILEYIDFYINGDGGEPGLRGSNDLTTNEAFLNTIYILEANKHFLAEEAFAFVVREFPNQSINEESYKRRIKEYVNAWIKDIQYSSNYNSILSARLYTNAVLGSKDDDMFYCRDATGVRNMTLDGLVGTITEQPVRYQDTIGSSYISLDPGWGPDHEECWITNRSPYIQNVTTLGYACVGQKIDGALHNGGNRSIVSNDFTQVISDGYGAWVTNNGRAELVSVFSYYSNVGYLATNGGIIRATNGNNSYGNFGVVADGRDTTEIPIIGRLNNRTTEATIVSSLVSTTGSILAVEYNNAGQSYSIADLTFIGSGAQATPVYDDFRDNAVFDVKPIDTQADEASTLNPIIIQEIGGSGYTLEQANAQPAIVSGGDNTTITLAVNDTNVEVQYLGMRLIVISGPGVGQYGYITSYNTTTKIVGVSRESDNQPGWDHIIPGTPNAIFTTGTTYRIEPRAIFDDPGFSSQEVDTETSGTWGAVIYGETSGTYTNVPGTPGSIGINLEEGFIPATATFDVVKTGRVYTVEINNPGAGYAVGDFLYISGELLEGISAENDILVIVTEVSDDSSNSIVSFDTVGDASSGSFVIFPESGANRILYSKNATDWETSVMPVSAPWTNVAAGNNTFVAISGTANSNVAAYSINGEDWTASTMPTSSTWVDVAFGSGTFIAIAIERNEAAKSSNGISWVEITMPNAGDSTFSQWSSITYGAGKFVAVSKSENSVAISIDLGSSWTTSTITIADNKQLDWQTVSFGNNRFVAIAVTGEVAWSFNGITWTQGTTLLNGSARMQFQKVKYAQGVFFAVARTDAGGATTRAFTSVDGIDWTSRTLSSSLPWRDIAFGNPDLRSEDSALGANTPIWVSVGGTTSSISKTITGKRAFGRCIVNGGRIGSIKILDPGSGYLTPPEVTVVSPAFTAQAEFRIRIADGVLSQPTWINRGFGYLGNTLVALVNGNGVADVIPVGKFISISSLSRLPQLGSQIVFNGDDSFYTIVTRQEISSDYTGITATFRITPELRVRDPFFHDTETLVREKVSQIRLTGHDFLDVGTGNFEQTNYPAIYATGLFTPAPENEVDNLNGGVVFYTSTDQLGNFRVGELFQVEQSTGIVTLSADFFDLAGLSELRLGGIRIGGTGTVIREFSTDVLFSADSNNVVPTQRAIARYLSGKLTVGGSEISTASFIAGTMFVGPTAIRNTGGINVVIPVNVNFTANSEVVGSMIAQTFFCSTFRELPDL
jgi:hypothetical protein